MKTQLSKPVRSKARYTDQYKPEALELWRASGRSAAKVAAERGSEHHCSIAGHGPGAKPISPAMSPSQGAV
jgi:hypothetical protein